MGPGNRIDPTHIPKARHGHPEELDDRCVFVFFMFVCIATGLKVGVFQGDHMFPLFHLCRSALTVKTLHSTGRDCRTGGRPRAKVEPPKVAQAGADGVARSSRGRGHLTR